MKTVAIVGVGLIGGSFALALRRAGFKGQIIGVSSPKTIQKAIRRRVIDEGLPLEEAVAQADLVYLATPISHILETLPVVDRHVGPGTLITDAGSTKAEICARAKKCVKRGVFIGGHPMAGKASRGVGEAQADLFEDHAYILTSRNRALEKWIKAIGARLVILDPKEHDRMVAVASHVPQLLSTVLALEIAAERSTAVAGPGAKDLTRLAESSFEIWEDILGTNRKAIDAALGRYIRRLEATRKLIGKPTMGLAFADAAAAAVAIRGTDSPRARR